MCGYTTVPEEVRTCCLNCTKQKSARTDQNKNGDTDIAYVPLFLQSAVFDQVAFDKVELWSRPNTRGIVLHGNCHVTVKAVIDEHLFVWLLITSRSRRQNDRYK